MESEAQSSLVAVLLGQFVYSLYHSFGRIISNVKEVFFRIFNKWLELISVNYWTACNCDHVCCIYPGILRVEVKKRIECSKRRETSSALIGRLEKTRTICITDQNWTSKVLRAFSRAWSQLRALRCVPSGSLMGKTRATLTSIRGLIDVPACTRIIVLLEQLM